MKIGRGSRILVTGGTGLVGINLVKRLLEVKIAPRVTYHSRPPILADDRIEYIRTDLTESESCAKAVNGIDIVFMCAASTSGAAAI